MEKHDLLKDRGGRIDPMKRRPGPLDADDRIDQAIAESFPASDPPSWNSGLEAVTRKKRPTKDRERG